MPNAEFLGRSRPRLTPGDVFGMRFYTGVWLFGRVIRVDLPTPMPGSNLIYIYDLKSSTPTPDRMALTAERLLIPPTFTNRQGWLRGFWRTVARWDLQPGEALARHCFWSVVRHEYLDEQGQPLQSRIEPCGTWGLASYVLIDDLISEALELPRAPLSDEQIRYFEKRGLPLPTASLGYRARGGSK